MSESESSGARGRRLSAALIAFRAFQFFVAVFGVIAVAAAAFVFLVYLHVVQPGAAGEKVDVTIPEGVTGKEAGRILEEKGLVEHQAFLRFAMRLDKSGRTIKHGRYALPGGLSPMELLRQLQDGPSRALDPSEIPPERRVTVAEGLSIEQAAQLFDDPDAYIEAASDPELIARLGIEAETLEGFLMPNTYYFDEKPTEREVVERMVEQFEKEHTALAAEFPETADYDKMLVVTVASLIEEEARVAGERPDIAAVIYNRIDKNMPLQMDSTLQYALKKYGERLLYEDMDVDSPYNTYRRTGLPPGPISSPGVASLRAAIRPADADYLYFVSNADGLTHTFSSTEAEHLEAVRRFRKEIGVQRREQMQQAPNASAQ